MKKLNSNVQLIKWFMAFFIVLFHDFTAFRLENNILFEPIIASSLTIFILLNGFLKVESKNYNFFKFFITIMCCWVLNTILILILNKTSNITVSNILFGGRDWWYIWCYILVQFFVPYLNKFLNCYNKWLTLFFSVLLFGICCCLSNYNMIGFGQMFNLWSVFYFITLYIIGGWIKKWIRIKGIKYFLIYLLMSLVTYFFIEYFTAPYCNGEKVHFYTTQINILFFSIILFLMLISVPSYSNKFIDYLGKLSLQVYLFHYIIQTLLVKYLFENKETIMNIYLQNFIYGICIFILTNIFAAIISIMTEKSTDLIYKQWLKVLPYIKLK